MIRILDVFFSGIGLILLSPVLLTIAILIKLGSKGPVIYKQLRVGVNGVEFRLWKFRSMHVDADQLGHLTVGKKDPRITNIGYILRKYKLDELPQLYNVLIGQMSLVGPRPEVRKYTAYYTDEQKKILLIRPGITDWASILYQNENEILGKSSDPEKDYINLVLPDKIKLNQIYLNKYSVNEYFKIILHTIFNIFFQKKEETKSSLIN